MQNANPNYAHLLVCCTEIFLGTKLHNGNCACHQIVLRLPRNVILQRTIPCTSHPEPRSNATRDFNRLRLPHNVTLQRTLPCTSHPEPRSNATRMLQSPATKCRTGAAPATQRHAATHMQRIPCTSHPDPHSNATRMLQSTAPATKCHTGVAPQRHTATHPSLHQPPRATLQRYQDASIDCHQMSHWLTSHCNIHATHPEPRSNATRMLQSTAPATKCHTGAAPATQRHNSTYHSLHQPHRSTLQLEVSRVQASQFHVHKRANFTCTSEPAPGGPPGRRTQNKCHLIEAGMADQHQESLLLLPFSSCSFMVGSKLSHLVSSEEWKEEIRREALSNDTWNWW